MPARRPIVGAWRTAGSSGLQPGPIVRSVTMGAVAAKAGAGTGVAPAAGRARSATVVGKAHSKAGSVGSGAKGAGTSGVNDGEDALAAMLEKYSGGGGEDFVFDV